MYTTRGGDTWDIVARNVYGDEYMAGKLMEANPGLLHIFRFDAGVKLVTPEREEEAGEALPPWKQQSV